MSFSLHAEATSSHSAAAAAPSRWSPNRSLREHLEHLCQCAANRSHPLQRVAVDMLARHWPDVGWCGEHRALVESELLRRSVAVREGKSPETHASCSVCMPAAASDVVLALESDKGDLTRGLAALSAVRDRWMKARVVERRAAQDMRATALSDANSAQKQADRRAARADERDAWLAYAAVVFEAVVPAVFRERPEQRGQGQHRSYALFMREFCANHAARNNVAGEPQLLCMLHPAPTSAASFPMLPTFGDVNCADFYHRECRMCAVKAVSVEVKPLANTLTREQWQRTEQSLLVQQQQLASASAMSD